MYRLKTSAAFDSAHFLFGYNGKCKNIHGHRWVIEVVIEGQELGSEGDKRGMLIDFGDLKKSVKALADSFDHTLIYEKGSLKESTLNALMDEDFKVIEIPVRPTAENLAKIFYDKLKAQSLPLKTVTVYETEENCAVYEEC